MPPSAPIYPLHNTTWTLHALSPLYNRGSNLTSPETLSSHSLRLKQYLKRDAILEQAPLEPSKTGTLQSCTWTILPSKSVWQAQQRDSGSDGTPPPISEDEQLGILIMLTYDTTTYNAILVRLSADADALPDGFSSYPLLLTRLPNATRLTLLDFLSTTFDTRVSPLKLPSSFIAGLLEGYLAALTTPIASQDGAAQAERGQRVLNVVKDIQLSFSFSNAPGLKTLDVTINREDVLKFLARPAPTSTVDRSDAEDSTPPFMTAISDHLYTHTALQITHPGIRLAKVSCGAFVLGASGSGDGGRMKILAVGETGDDEERDAVEKANVGLVVGVVRWAKG
jgi:hypothetical protein